MCGEWREESLSRRLRMTREDKGPCRMCIYCEGSWCIGLQSRHEGEEFVQNSGIHDRLMLAIAFTMKSPPSQPAASPQLDQFLR